MTKKRSKPHLTGLIDRCRESNESAWYELMDLLTPVIFSICRRQHLSREESFDIYGTVSLELVNTISTLQSADKIISFTATITRRRIADYFERKSSRDTVEHDDVSDLFGEAAETPHERLESEQRTQAVARAMLSLPERDRRLLHALFFDEKRPTYEEIAQRLEMPVSSIGPTRARSLKKLQKILSKSGHVFRFP